MSKKKNRTGTKKKIRYKRIIIVLILLVGFFYGLYKLFTLKITNIYIVGNNYLSDQEVIERLGIQNYPKAISIWNFTKGKLLTENPLIKNYNIEHKNFTELYITIEENTPLVYHLDSKQTWLEDGQQLKSKFLLPVLINDIPSNLQEQFLESFSMIDANIRMRISELKYDPGVDEKRFFLTLTDGNYVYINLDNMTVLNDYLNIIKNFPDKKGILYLDAGSHFKVFDE